MTPAIQFYPYQRKWLNDDSRFKIGMFSRQTGKTFTNGGEIVDDCAKHAAAGKKTRWVILSRGEHQAAEMMNESIKPMTKAFWAAYGAIKEPTFDVDEFKAPDGTAYKALEVHFPGGSRITALPANPDTARGFSANVFLDEFAFHDKSKEIWGALFPVISKPGLKLRVVSTPNGKGNKFYELMTGKDERWSRHEVDIYKAVAEGCPRDIDELREGISDSDLWAQEYELQWLDEASAWLPYELITSCEDAKAGDPSLYTGGRCLVGVDIAARNDLFVIWVDEIVGDVKVNRQIITRKRISFAEQDRLLDEVFDRYRVTRCLMDQTGMGEKPVEDAKRRYGESRVQGVLFTAAAKFEMATRFKQEFEDRTRRIPQGDVKLRGDLHSVAKVVGATGVPRLLADREGDSHADRFWAGALASEAGADEGYQPYDYQPVKLPRDADARPVKITAGFRTQKGAW